MLPAVSANLPVYLLPPRGSGEGQTTTEQSSFGPAARLDLSRPDSEAAQRTSPGTGLYGPDGQFIEGAARRQTEGQTTSNGQTEADLPGDRVAPRETAAEEVAPRGVEARSARTASGSQAAPRSTGNRDTDGVIHGADRADRPTRDLSLSEADVAIPPPVREELVALVDRLKSKEESRNFDAEDYKQIARLLEKVGRFDDAVRARDRADELQNPGEQTDASRSDTTAPEVSSRDASADELVH